MENVEDNQNNNIAESDSVEVVPPVEINSDSHEWSKEQSVELIEEITPPVFSQLSIARPAKWLSKSVNKLFVPPSPLKKSASNEDLTAKDKKSVWYHFRRNLTGEQSTPPGKTFVTHTNAGVWQETSFSNISGIEKIQDISASYPALSANKSNLSDSPLFDRDNQNPPLRRSVSESSIDSLLSIAAGGEKLVEPRTEDFPKKNQASAPTIPDLVTLKKQKVTGTIPTICYWLQQKSSSEVGTLRLKRILQRGFKYFKTKKT